MRVSLSLSPLLSTLVSLIFILALPPPPLFFFVSTRVAQDLKLDVSRWGEWKLKPWWRPWLRRSWFLMREIDWFHTALPLSLLLPITLHAYSSKKKKVTNEKFLSFPIGRGSWGDELFGNSMAASEWGMSPQQGIRESQVIRRIVESDLTCLRREQEDRHEWHFPANSADLPTVASPRNLCAKTKFTRAGSHIFSGGF